MQQSEQFKIYSFLILDLCSTIENDHYASGKEGECAPLVTYINALKQEITTINKLQEELQAKLAGMDKETSVKAAEKYVEGNPDTLDPSKAVRKPTHTSAYVPLDSTAMESEAY